MANDRKAPLASPWSNLPKEIVSKIETCLDSAIDMSQLRSACKNWRASRNPDNVSILCPFLPRTISNANLPFTDRPNAVVTLVARAVFLVKPLRYAPNPDGFLLTVEEIVPGKLRILYPLSKDRVTNLPSNCPKYLELSEFIVSQVAKSYGIKYESDGEDVPGVCRVVLCSRCTAMVLYGGGTLIGLRLKTGYWSYVRQSIISSFSDVISYGGNQVRAIDCKGNVHIIDYKATMVIKTILLVSEIHGADQKILIRSKGELFAAACFQRKTEFTFVTYQLDEAQRQWLRYDNTHYCSKVLFISTDWSFLLYTRDLDLRHYSPKPKRAVDVDLDVICSEEKDAMSGDYVIYSETSFTYPSYVYNLSNTSRLYQGSSLDLRIGVFFCNKYEDVRFWNVSCSRTTIDVLWPPPTWLWPDKYSSSREDEDLDIHSGDASMCYKKDDKLRSCSTDASTRDVITAVGNSNALTMELSKEEDSRTCFEGIEVKFEHLPILQEIWRKHGDVFEGSSLRSCEAKAMALTCLAKILITLRTHGEGLTNDQISNVETTLADLQLMGLKLDWLVPLVETILTLHKQLQADLEAFMVVEAQLNDTRKRLLAVMAEVDHELDIDV